MIRVATLLLLFAMMTPSVFAQATGTAPPPNAPKKPHPALLNPKLATAKAPEKFDVLVKTTKGDFVLTVQRDWSPNGADRFYNLVNIGYFQEIGIFRAIKGFMCQFGIHGDPKVNKQWAEANIKDDKPKRGVSNKPGMITFAKTGLPNSRSTQFFINLGDNGFLDSQGFTPFGQVTKGGEVVTKINTEYGENPRNENVQGDFKDKGNAYIKKRFPRIDFIKSMTLVQPKKASSTGSAAPK